MTRALVEAAGSCLMVGFAGNDPPPELLQRLERSEVAGVILFSRNLGGGPGQVATLTRTLQAAASGGPPLLIGIDQEGGRVQRLRAPLAVWPPMGWLGLVDDLQLTERVGLAIGEDLRQLGFNLDFAPVLDVVSGETNQVVGDRSFGPDPLTVGRQGLALARGLQRAGVLPCGKHFPGHGGPVDDSHHTLPVEHRSTQELRRCDLLPFAAAIQAGFPLLMSAHVVYAGIDPVQPGTLSPAIATELLRQELGFSGVLVSDDMEMAAVADSQGPGELALRALRAGVDLLLFCHREDRQRAALEALVHAAEASSTDRERLLSAASRVQALRGGLPAAEALPPEAAAVAVDASRHTGLLAELRLRTGKNF